MKTWRVDRAYSMRTHGRRMYVCMHVRTYVRMYACMYVHVCVSVCCDIPIVYIYVCIYAYIYIYIYSHILDTIHIFYSIVFQHNIIKCAWEADSEIR